MADQIVVDNRVFFCHCERGCIYFAYRQICHENPNQTRIVLKVFSKIKLRFGCIIESQQLRTEYPNS